MFVRLKHVRRVRSKGREYWYHRVLVGKCLPADETARVKLVLEINAALERGDSVEEVRAAFGWSRSPSGAKHIKHVRSKGRNYFYHRVKGDRLPDDAALRAARVEEIDATLGKV